MDTDKQKLNKLQTKLASLEKEMTKLKEVLTFTLKHTKGCQIIGFYEYFLFSSEKILSDMEKIMKK